MDAEVRELRENKETLEMRANEDGQRVSQLEAALLICKEELTGYIDKLDGMRDRHEKDLQNKKTEVGESGLVSFCKVTLVSGVISLLMWSLPVSFPR